MAVSMMIQLAFVSVPEVCAFVVAMERGEGAAEVPLQEA